MYSLCIINVLSMYYQCISQLFRACNEISMYFLCIINVLTMYNQCIIIFYSKKMDKTVVKRNVKRKASNKINETDVSEEEELVVTKEV